MIATFASGQRRATSKRLRPCAGLRIGIRLKSSVASVGAFGNAGRSRSSRLTPRLRSVRSMAERLAAGPRAAQAAVKRLVALAGSTLEAHLAIESETISRQSVTPEGQEGIKAFLEKRKPRFD